MCLIQVRPRRALADHSRTSSAERFQDAVAEIFAEGW
jgi:hypothetical protein